MFLLLFISGCSILPFNKNVEQSISNLPADAILVNTSEIKSHTIELIESAQEAIFIQLSSLDEAQILNLLMKKSKDGVEVRILLDQWQRENSSTVRTLKNNNVSVQYYPAQKGQYQKVRYMVVDYATAVFYGDDWTAKGFGSDTLAVKLLGDTAWKITKSFEKDWLYTTTITLKLPDKIDLPEENIIFAINANVRQQIIRYINSAETEIKIIVEQFSDTDTVNALLEAKARGVDIKLIITPAGAASTPNTIKMFEDAEIDLHYYYHPEDLALRSNFAIFDNKTVIITSSSWTYYSFVINHECSLTIPSPEVVNVMNNLFEQKWNSGI